MTRADYEFETILRRADEAVGELMSGNGNGNGKPKRPRRIRIAPGVTMVPGRPDRHLLSAALRAWAAWRKDPGGFGLQMTFCQAAAAAVAAGFELRPDMLADVNRVCAQAEAEVELEALLQEAELKVIQGGGKRRSPPKRGHLASMPTGPNAPSYAERLESLNASAKYGDPDFCRSYRTLRASTRR